MTADGHEVPDAEVPGDRDAQRGGRDEVVLAGVGVVATHRVIRGRRWRVSDPRIPEPLRQALVDELMSARRAVKHAGDDAAAERAARDRVHDAKVALGERGVAWWEDAPDPDLVTDRIVRADRAIRRALPDPGTDPVTAVAAITSCPAPRVAAVLDRD